MKFSEQSKKRTLYRNAHRYFLLALIVIGIGFFPSYFSRLTSADTAHHLHGITATLWMLLLITQPWLFHRGYMKWHRALGKFTFILVPLLFVSGLHMIYLMLTNASNYPPLIPYQLAFIDFTVLPIFILFYSLAIFHRKNIQLHARYMVCTIFGPLIPALTRMLFIVPFIDNFSKSLNISYLIVELVILILLWDDRRAGKIRTPYLLALIIFLTDHILMNVAWQWTWWRSWMDTFQIQIFNILSP